MRKLYVQDKIYEANNGIVDWSDFSADEFAFDVDNTKIIAYDGMLMMFDVTQNDMGDIFLSEANCEDDERTFYEIGGEE